MIRQILVGLVMIVLIATSMCAVCLTDADKSANEYYRSAEVFRIERGVAYLEDTQGHVWCVEDDTLQKYGRYVLVMDSCGTDDITDDVILRVK